MNRIYKIRILHVCYSATGGIGAVVKSLQKSFSGEIISLPNNDVLRRSLLSKIIDYNLLYKNIIAKSKSTDVIHFHGAWTLDLLPLLTNIGARAITSPHGALHKESLKKSRIKKSLAKFLYMKRAFLNSKCIHALTNKEVDDIYSYGIKSVPIAVIPNGIEINKCLNINMKLQIELRKLSRSRKVILSLSRLHVAKGIENLIDAFYMLNNDNQDSVLFIVGRGGKKYEKKLKAKIKKLSLQNSVYLLGEMTGIDKNTIYDIADLFVLPSHNEGFSLTVLEAYRQKIPVITTTATPFQEIKTIGCGWYVNPNADELYIALHEATCLEDIKLKQMGIKGYKWVVEKYNLDVIMTMYSELYNWVAFGGKEPLFVTRYQARIDSIGCQPYL